MKARPDPSTKQYYKCLYCPNFRKICGGKPTRGMTLKEWCEYIRDVMDVYHLTNALVANEVNVSIKTMERISAGSIENIGRETFRSIEIFVLGQMGTHICYLDHDNSALLEQIRKLTEENEFLLKENERKAKIIDKLLG